MSIIVSWDLDHIELQKGRSVAGGVLCKLTRMFWRQLLLTVMTMPVTVPVDSSVLCGIHRIVSQQSTLETTLT